MISMSKNRIIKLYRELIRVKYPFIKEYSDSEYAFKRRTFKQKGYVPKYSLVSNLAQLYHKPKNNWTDKDLNQATEILKYFRIYL